MDEYQIEMRVEKATDRLDKRFMSDANTMTQEEYDNEIKILGRWAQQQYDNLASAPFTASDRKQDY